MRFGLILAEAMQGLRRNASMVVSVVLVTFVSLTFVGAALVMQMQIVQMKGYWYDRAQVAIYMCTDVSTGVNCTEGLATDEQIEVVESMLESETLSPFIKEVTFVTQEEAYEQFQEQFAGNPAAEIATPEIMSETFWVNMVDPSESAVLIEAFSSIEGVESVVDQRKYLDQVFVMLNVASYAAVAIAIIMLVAAALLVATTIRLSAYARRREISIMRLVGASNRFIQTPFVLEGVIASVIGSLFAGAAVVAVVHFFVQGWLSQRFAAVSLVTMGDALLVMPVLVVIGALLAAVSANIAIARYLRV